MMSILKQKILKLPELQILNGGTIPLIQNLLTQFQKKIDNNLQLAEQTIEKYERQFQNFINKLVNPRSIVLLKDQNHRALIIAFIECGAIQHYKYSYFNRAKLSKKHIERMKQVGPILFSQAVMIASKINLINKKNARNFIEDNLYTQSESPIDMKIQQILKLCDQKKRNVNNNLKKLQLILEDPNYFEVIKQLGKMLRDSWKKDKSKIKIQDVVKTPFQNNGIANFTKQITRKNMEDQESDNESCQTIKLSQSDIFSFTSSQNQIIRQHQQQSSKSKKNVSFMPQLFQQDYSSFRVKSSFLNQSQNNYPLDFI